MGNPRERNAGRCDSVSGLWQPAAGECTLPVVGLAHYFKTTKCQAIMKTQIYIGVITAILISLFLFTGMEKVWYHQAFVIKLGRQPLPDWMKSGLAWGLPLAELTVVGLLTA